MFWEIKVGEGLEVPVLINGNLYRKNKNIRQYNESINESYPFLSDMTRKDIIFCTVDRCYFKKRSDTIVTYKVLHGQNHYRR